MPLHFEILLIKLYARQPRTRLNCTTASCSRSSSTSRDREVKHWSAVATPLASASPRTRTLADCALLPASVYTQDQVPPAPPTILLLLIIIIIICKAIFLIPVLFGVDLLFGPPCYVSRL